MKILFFIFLNNVWYFVFCESNRIAYSRTEEFYVFKDNLLLTIPAKEIDWICSNFEILNGFRHPATQVFYCLTIYKKKKEHEKWQKNLNNSKPSKQLPSDSLPKFSMHFWSLTSGWGHLRWRVHFGFPCLPLTVVIPKWALQRGCQICQICSATF